MPVFMDIFIVFNTFRKLILKCTSLFSKNTFKSPKFQNIFDKKIERIKCISFWTTAEVDLGLLQHLRRKKTLLWLHTHACTQGNYMFKVNNRNTRTKCEICSKLTIKMPERPQTRRRSGIFIVNFEHISHLVLLFLSLTLSR